MEISHATFSTIEGDVTLDGEAKKLTFEFDFTGAQLHEICATAARMLRTDIQNQLRPQTSDSTEKATSKKAKLKAFIEEQALHGKVKMVFKDMRKRMALNTMTAEEQIENMSTERLEAMLALINSKLGK